jgi:hypothetical protein
VILFTRAVVCVLAVVVGYASASAGQQLDDAAIEAAIRIGQGKPSNALLAVCHASASFTENLQARSGIHRTGSFTVVTSLAPGRIANAAAVAKRFHKPYGVADVPPEWRQLDTVYVFVEPDTPRVTSKSIAVAAPIQHVILKAKNGEAVVQPKDVQLKPVEWTNALGGKIEGNSATATFAAKDVREVPPGDLDVVIITATVERRCKIGQEDRTKIFTP